MAVVVVLSNENEGNAGIWKLDTALVAASRDDDGKVIIATTINFNSTDFTFNILVANLISSSTRSAETKNILLVPSITMF